MFLCGPLAAFCGVGRFVLRTFYSEHQAGVSVTRRLFDNLVGRGIKVIDGFGGWFAPWM
jgi:hypothetical protein